MARLDVRSQTLLRRLDRAIYAVELFLRRLALVGDARVLAYRPRVGRWGADDRVAGGAVRGISARGSGNGDGAVRTWRDGRSDNRSDGGWMDNRQLRLALDLLHQSAGRHSRLSHDRDVRA